MRILIRKVFLIFAVCIILSPGTIFSYSAEKKQILAILPFENLSGYKSIDWISEGIASSLITKLSEVKDLIIVERYYVKKILDEIKLKLTGITEGAAVDTGKLLSANIIVTGDIQYFDRNIKISMRVIDVNTGKIEGSGEVTGELKDIFFLEDKLSQRILSLIGKSAEGIGQFEVSSVNTTSIKAYEEYSMAKKAWDGKSIEPENIRTAIEHYRKALKHDSSFFLAAMELGDALGEIAEFDEALKWFKYALKLGKKTIKDKNTVNYCKDKVYEKTSLTYLKKGNLKKAFSTLQKAFKVHPRCFTSYRLLGRIFEKEGEIEKAISAYRKAIEIKPYDPDGYYSLGAILLAKGEKPEARKAFLKSIETDHFGEFTKKAQIYLNRIPE